MEANPFDTIGELGDGLPLTTDMRIWLASPGVFKKLHRIHPDLTAPVRRIVAAMAMLGLRMMVTDGVRSREEQQALYAQGRTVPGKIVTHLDGVTRRSNHQPKLAPSRYEGFGAAVDLTFVDDDGKPSWSDEWPWALYGAMAKSQQLVWGGDWPTMTDRPHIELFE